VGKYPRGGGVRVRTTAVAVLVVGVALVAASFAMLLHGSEFVRRVTGSTGALEWPTWWLYLAVPAGAACTLAAWDTEVGARRAGFLMILNVHKKCFPGGNAWLDEKRRGFLRLQYV